MAAVKLAIGRQRSMPFYYRQRSFPSQNAIINIIIKFTKRIHYNFHYREVYISCTDCVF